MGARGSSPQRRRGARRGRRLSRGQAIVEFAMVAPLFLLMLFGFIEFALIGASVAAFNFAAKDAARLGSYLATTTCDVDNQMVNLIKGRVSGVVVAHLVTIEIFKSDATGAYQGTVEDSYDNTAGGTAPCWKVLAGMCPSGIQGLINCTWPVDMRNDSLINADYLGVRISYNYTYLTAFISGGNSTLSLTATAVQRIEPQSFQGHRSLPGVALSSTARAPRATASEPTTGDIAQPAVLTADTRRRRTTGGVL
jgi:TadE-like protein